MEEEKGWDQNESAGTVDEANEAHPALREGWAAGLQATEGIPSPFCLPLGLGRKWWGEGGNRDRE